MKKTIALAAVALMCGTSVYAQTADTTTDQQSNTQVHGQPTIEPGAAGAVSSTEADKLNAPDSTTGSTMTTGAGSTTNTTADQQSNTQVHGQPTIEPGAAGAVSSTEAGKLDQQPDTGATMSTGTTGAGAAATTTTTTTTGTMSTGATSTGADMPAAGSATTTASTGMSNGADLAQFDANNDGSLTPLEFGQMVMSSRATASGNTGLAAEAKRERFSKASGNGAIKLLNATADEFARADKNMDKRIDQSELAMWQPGAAPNM